MKNLKLYKEVIVDYEGRLTDKHVKVVNVKVKKNVVTADVFLFSEGVTERYDNVEYPIKLFQEVIK